MGLWIEAKERWIGASISDLWGHDSFLSMERNSLWKVRNAAVPISSAFDITDETRWKSPINWNTIAGLPTYLSVIETILLCKLWLQFLCNLFWFWFGPCNKRGIALNEVTLSELRPYPKQSRPVEGNRDTGHRRPMLPPHKNNSQSQIEYETSKYEWRCQLT